MRAVKWARRKLTVDSELEGGQSTDHEKTGGETGERAAEAELLANLGQTGDGALAGQALGLVDLAKHGVGGLGDDGGGETGDQTAAQVDGRLQAIGHVLLGGLAVDGLGDLLVDDKLGHRVGDPRKEDRRLEIRTRTPMNGTSRTKTHGNFSGLHDRWNTYCLKRMGPKPA